MARGTAWLISGGLALALASATRAAHADGAMDRSPGFTIGARVGGAVPFGHVSGNYAGDAVEGAVPIWLDLGYRFSHHFSIGAEVSYAVAYIPDNGFGGCDGVTTDCTGHLWRFGISAIWHFLPCFKFDPWTSLGVGYEQLGLAATDALSGEDLGTAYLSGPQFVHVGLGGDYHVDRLFDVGPFVDVSVADYQTDDSVHYWLTFGLRATLNP
jgi:hypothetical protein